MFTVILLIFLSMAEKSCRFFSEWLFKKWTRLLGRTVGQQHTSATDWVADYICFKNLNFLMITGPPPPPSKKRISIVRCKHYFLKQLNLFRTWAEGPGVEEKDIWRMFQTNRVQSRQKTFQVERIAEPGWGWTGSDPGWGWQDPNLDWGWQALDTGLGLQDPGWGLKKKV